MDCKKYKILLRDVGLRSYLATKDVSGRMLEKYDYFMVQMGKNCAYADACIKIMREDIDEYYAGSEEDRKTDSSEEGLRGFARTLSASRDSQDTSGRSTGRIDRTRG